MIILNRSQVPFSHRRTTHLVRSRLEVTVRTLDIEGECHEGFVYLALQNKPAIQGERWRKREEESPKAKSELGTEGSGYYEKEREKERKSERKRKIGLASL